MPFELANCADLGDSPVNPADVDDGLARVEAFFKQVVAKDVLPLSAGGDHLVSLPILRAVGEKSPVGMIHFDAHTDLWDGYFGGFTFTHGTPFRRAIEEGVLDPKRTMQIGLRGSVYDMEDRAFGEKMGVRMMDIEEAVALGPDKVMAEAREIAGDAPTYVSFDIDCLDPAFAPGTGTPEVGGFTTREAAGHAARPARPQHLRRRRGRGVAAVRSLGLHGARGRHHDVRAALRDGGGEGEPGHRLTGCAPIWPS